MNNPVVSVVIPSFNHEKYIEETIESILNQTFQDFEIIITDDGSSDKTLEKIKKFSDPRIELFIFKENQGACKALNHCINNSNGKYIAYISSDDVWELNKLEKQIKYLNENPSIPVIFTYVKIIDENGVEHLEKNHRYSTIFEQKNHDRSIWLNRFFYKGNCICHPSIMIRKDIYNDIGLYNERMGNLPDLDMWVRLCMKYNFNILDEKLTRFRIRDDEKNVSGDKPATHIRSRFEKLHIFDHYLKIDDIDFFLRIFPDAQKFGILKLPSMIPYFLARLAYEANVNVELMQLWALNTLYDLMQSNEAIDILKHDYNFSYSDFLEMSAQADLFSLKKLTELNSMINRRNDIIRNKDKMIHQKDAIIIQKDSALIQKDSSLINLDRKNDLLIKDIDSLIKERKLLIRNENINSKKYLQIEKLNNLLEKQLQITYKKTLHQRLFSKFPRLNILFNRNNTGIKNVYMNIKGYNEIKKNDLFDIDYYLKNNSDVRLSGTDPIIHYIYHGFKEGRNPNPEFDGLYYQEKYDDVKKSQINPLVHYSIFGIKEGRKTIKTDHGQDISNGSNKTKSLQIIQFTPENTKNPYYTIMGDELISRGINFSYIDDFQTVKQILKTKPCLVHFHQLSPFYHGQNERETLENSKKLLENLRNIKELGAKIVYTMHNPLPHNRIFSDIDKNLNKELFSISDQIIVLGQTAKEFLIRDQKVVTPISVIQHPTLREYYGIPHSKNDARKELGFPEDAVIFGNIGHIKPYKGLEFIIESFNQFLKSNPSQKQLILCLAGTSPDKEYINSLKEKYEQKNVLIIERYLSNSELKKFISALDYSVFAFKDIWASSSVVLSISYGIPVIVPDIGCMGDYVNDLNNGLLYQSNNQNSLINTFKTALNLEYYDHLNYMCNAFSQENNVSKTSDELLNVYKNILKDL